MNEIRTWVEIQGGRIRIENAEVTIGGVPFLDSGAPFSEADQAASTESADSCLVKDLRYQVADLKAKLKRAREDEHGPTGIWARLHEATAERERQSQRAARAEAEVDRLRSVVVDSAADRGTIARVRDVVWTRRYGLGGGELWEEPGGCDERV